MTRQAARFLSISGYALNAQKTSHDSTQSGYDVVAEVDTMSCLQTPVGEGPFRRLVEELYKRIRDLRLGAKIPLSSQQEERSPCRTQDDWGQSPGVYLLPSSQTANVLSIPPFAFSLLPFPFSLCS